jgi:hypothetical protein
MSMAHYLLHRPFCPLANRGDRFTLKWKGSPSRGWSATTIGVVPALTSFAVAVLLGAVVVYSAATARASDEWQTVAVMSAMLTVVLAIGMGRLFTFSTIRCNERSIVRRRRIAGVPVGRIQAAEREVSVDVGPLEITCTLLNYKPDPPLRHACVLRGLGDPIVLAMSTDAAAIDAYAEALPPPLAAVVRRVENQGLKGPTAVII